MELFEDDSFENLFQTLFGQFVVDEKERQTKLIDLIESYDKTEGSKLLRDIGAGLHLWSIMNGYNVLDIIDILHEIATNVDNKMAEKGLP